MVLRITGSEILDRSIRNFLGISASDDQNKNHLQMPNDLTRILDAIGSICNWLSDKEAMIPANEFKYFSKMLTNILSADELILIYYFINVSDGVRYISSISKVIDFVPMDRESTTFQNAQSLLKR
ncbi:hypothetical protein EHQ61_16340 [Leptospira wolffii]|uniref:hypothetical protein n=1 Tax=Leptospira wolffii TaxID=409998 RepID=UPI001083D4DA|nr:hypothetical protein [Leptospira wolffii]TGL46720.1 hypothetical protein EHQ61_16340 [Leptospira wolffii]